MNREKYVLAGFIIVAVVSAVFVYQPIWGQLSEFRPWRFGLDVAGGSYLEYEVDVSAVGTSDAESVLTGLRSVIERRVDLFGVSEPHVYTRTVGDSKRLVVELAGVKDIDAAIAEIGETPLLDFREVSMDEDGNYIYTPTGLSGRHIKGASVSFNQYTSAPVISFELTDEGGKLFEALTGRNIGKPIAVFLDDELVEQPTVKEKISGGRAQISGNFTIEDAREMVARFNAGALPAPITLVNRETVSPTLGETSFRKVLMAGAAGFILVIAYMVVYYRKLGIFAAAALAVYVLLSLAVFKLIPVTLSVSSIAGLVLSLGMAVDANVLVFERIREELKENATHKEAVENGFKRAWSSIRDANLTTMISSAILFYITTSFVRGFALALLIGVAMSMLTAVVFTRTMLRMTKK